MAVSATFSTRGTLTVLGDTLSNALVVSRNAGGTLLVNGGATPIAGGPATVFNTRLVQINGAEGDDTLLMNEAFGPLPKASLSGGNGNDSMSGGSRDDLLLGDAGNDTMLGQGGIDLLLGGDGADELGGGEGNDFLTGGDGNDRVHGDGGDDRLIWNPGDDTDVFEGGSGIDTAEVNGGEGSEIFTLTANATRVRFDRLDPAPFSIDAGTMEQFVVNMKGGNDSFSATGNLAALVGLSVDGGTGNDTVSGSNGADRVSGGDGDDFVDGQQGADTALLGAGNDVFQWDPGDGSDVVEGQDGTDKLLFNGSAANEIFALSAVGGRASFTRNLGNIVMDLSGVEQIELHALGGTDSLTVNDLAGTVVNRVDIDLAANIGGTVGDGQVDAVTAHAGNGNDIVDVFGSGTSALVIGLAATVNIVNAEGANDALVVSGGGGTDNLAATTLPAGVIQLTMDGGDGNDRLLGSQGADLLLGGGDDDFVFGDNGNDTALLGSGNDVFQWDPGDGSDVVEGQSGSDTLLFFGSNVGENINVLANGGRTQFLRDVANITMDLDDVERIEFRALGGADSITVGNLFGTDTTRVDLDLRGPNGGTDGALDNVTVNATEGADVFGVAGDSGGVTVFGLPAQVNLFFADAADRLTLNGLGGDDVIDAASLEAGTVQLTMNGGLGADLFIGSDGDDLITGGDGIDTALMGLGDDRFVWNPGDDNDVLEGQGGFDTMLFNGANIAELITISANGGRATFFRNIANVLMDLDDVESIDFNALGGADSIVINDLSGTDLTEININLASSIGGSVGDGAADVVTINATAGDDVVLVSGGSGGVSVFGLAAQVNITGFEVGVDRLVINLLAGDDVLEASGLTASGLLLTGDGGDDDDVLVGGDGPDTLIGGVGDDVLIGGPGTDVLDGGLGNNIVIQLVGTTINPAAMF